LFTLAVNCLSRCRQKLLGTLKKMVDCIIPSSIIQVFIVNKIIMILRGLSSVSNVLECLEIERVSNDRCQTNKCTFIFSRQRETCTIGLFSSSSLTFFYLSLVSGPESCLHYSVNFWCIRYVSLPLNYVRQREFKLLNN